MRIDISQKRHAWVGVLGCECMAMISILLPTLHAIPGLGETIAQQNHTTLNLLPTTVFSYWVAAAIGEPIIILSILLFVSYFWFEWLNEQDLWAKRVVISGIFYAAVRIFWAYSTYYYYQQVSGVLGGEFVEELLIPNMLRGISALAGGLSAIVFAYFLIRFFDNRGHKVAKFGALLTVILTVAAIVAKTLTIWILPYTLTVVFLLLLCGKSIGLTLMTFGLLSKQLGQDVSK